MMYANAQEANFILRVYSYGQKYIPETIPVSKNDILNEYILYNKNILANTKMLEPNYF